MAYRTISEAETASAVSHFGKRSQVTAKEVGQKLKVTSRRAAKILLRAGFKILKETVGPAKLYRRRKQS